MWSKTRQVLESRLAEKLKGCVSYHYDVYRTKGCKEKRDNDIIREMGLVAGGFWEKKVMGYIHEYLNELSIEDAINNDNYFIRLLAVLDARLGKRKVKALVDNIENEPQWFRKWILLRNGENSNKE